MTASRGQAANRSRPPHVLHNMSVPSTSRVTVSRVRLPGLRFGVVIPHAFGNQGNDLRQRLAIGGWEAAWAFLGPSEPELRAVWFSGRWRREDMERHLLESLRKAGIPDRPGVFLEPEEADPDRPPALSPIAALAVLSRRSGPIYLPSRHLEPSLADPRRPLVLFFPEEEPE